MMPELSVRGSTTGRGKKISEVVARLILKDARRRGLQPGARLESEADMIERLGVGRASLREALRILEVQGLLRIRSGPRGGPVLTQVTSRDFGRTSTLYFMAGGATYREVIEARVAVTGLMARLAAERAPADGLERLRQAIEVTEEALQAEDRAWANIASGFYATIAELCGNRVVALFCMALMSIYVDHLPPMRLGPEHRRRILSIYKQIAAAVGRADGAEAERLMAEHLLEFARDVGRAYPAFMDEIVDWE